MEAPEELPADLDDRRADITCRPPEVVERGRRGGNRADRVPLRDESSAGAVMVEIDGLHLALLPGCYGCSGTWVAHSLRNRSMRSTPSTKLTTFNRSFGWCTSLASSMFTLNGEKP